MLLLDYVKFLIFGRHKKNDEVISLVADECSRELLTQISQVKNVYSSDIALRKELCSKNVTAFIFGFISDYTERHNLKRTKEVWSVTVQVFHIIFNENAYGTAKETSGIQLELLQNLMKKDDSKSWITEGKNAAFYGRNGTVKLFVAFLEGAAR